MFKAPKTKEEAIDRYHQIRKERLRLEGEAREMKVEEGILENFILENYAGQWQGSHGIAEVLYKDKYSIANMAGVYKYASEHTNGFSLLISRLNEKSCREWPLKLPKSIGVIKDVPVLSYRTF